jgi:hypothetical protein
VFAVKILLKSYWNRAIKNIIYMAVFSNTKHRRQKSLITKIRKRTVFMHSTKRSVYLTKGIKVYEAWCLTNFTRNPEWVKSKRVWQNHRRCWCITGIQRPCSAYHGTISVDCDKFVFYDSAIIEETFGKRMFIIKNSVPRWPRTQNAGRIWTTFWHGIQKLYYCW